MNNGCGGGRRKTEVLGNERVPAQFHASKNLHRLSWDCNTVPLGKLSVLLENYVSSVTNVTGILFTAVY